MTCPIDFLTIIPPTDTSQTTEVINFLSQVEEAAAMIRNNLLSAPPGSDAMKQCTDCETALKNQISPAKNPSNAEEQSSYLLDMVNTVIEANRPDLINTIVLIGNMTGKRLNFNWSSTSKIPCYILLYADPVLLQAKDFSLCNFYEKIDPANSVVNIPRSSVKDFVNCKVSPTCQWLSSFNAHSKKCSSIVNEYVNIDLSDPNGIDNFVDSICGGTFLGDPDQNNTSSSPCQNTMKKSLQTGIIDSMQSCCKEGQSVTQAQWLRWLIIIVAVVLCIVLIWIIFELFRKMSGEKRLIPASSHSST